MSTNQQYRNLTADPPPQDAKEPETKASKLDLSVTKIVGGALAAMTAAALGSRLSVAGTIVGAALASVIAAVASALYTASLKHTQEKVRTVWTGRTGGRRRADHDRGHRHPPPSHELVGPGPAQRAAVGPAEPGSAAQPRKPLSWKSIVVAALATFGIAAVSLTAYELISGQALSGGEGTTITQASEPRKAPEQKKPAGTETKSPHRPRSRAAPTAPNPSRPRPPASSPLPSRARRPVSRRRPPRPPPRRVRLRPRPRSPSAEQHRAEPTLLVEQRSASP